MLTSSVKPHVIDVDLQSKSSLVWIQAIDASVNILPWTLFGYRLHPPAWMRSRPLRTTGVTKRMMWDWNRRGHVGFIEISPRLSKCLQSALARAWACSPFHGSIVKTDWHVKGCIPLYDQEILTVGMMEVRSLPQFVVTLAREGFN